MNYDSSTINNTSLKETENKPNSDISNEPIDNKLLFYNTESNAYNQINKYNNSILNKAKYRQNNDYFNYLISKKYKNSSSDQFKEDIHNNNSNNNYNNNIDNIDNNEKANSKIDSYDTNNIESRLNNINIGENKRDNDVQDTHSILQTIESEKRKLYDKFVSNKSSSFDANKWNNEYDKLNTLDKLNKYTDQRYRTNAKTNYDISSNNYNIDNKKDDYIKDKISINSEDNINNYDCIKNEIKNENNYVNNDNNNKTSPLPSTMNDNSKADTTKNKNNEEIKPYVHNYIKNNPNPNLYDMRYYQRLNSSKRVQELLGGLNVELLK